jgi:MoxR-like ATPase
VTRERGGHAELAERAARILDEVERAVVGKRPVLELVLLGLLADGHVLIEDNPGLAKTLMARSFAAVTGLRFARVQFTPDLMPSDVTGSAIYDQRSAELRFQPGPIFTHVLLGDEINRAPPKTQAALLEAMQERQVTSEDGTRALERPFLVLATQNPIEYRGPIRSQRRSSTGSCCASAWATPTAARRLSWRRGAWSAVATTSSCA